MKFHDFWGKGEYKAALAKLYQADKEAWMTPVEVFYPYYSHAIANYMLMAPFTTDKLTIFEIGGGAGTNANDSCYFVAMEVLDNLPHDKVTQEGGQWHETWVNPKTLSEHHRPLTDPLIRQTLEHFPLELPLREQYKPAARYFSAQSMHSLNDRSFRFLRKALRMPEKTLHSAFVPTGAMQLLNTLKTSFPKHHLIAADFDELPAPSLDAASATHQLYNHPRSPTSTASGSLHAANAPLVASKTAGVTFDHDTYLVEGGIADVFFSTDFIKLKHAYCQAHHRHSHEVSIVKSRAFLEKFADIAKTRTILGYAPSRS
ncbi:hypothetical protein DYB32_000757 [Aphanomyces invadans]|uniref:Protein arginine methyltransferase NDUFAF7 n=1 Tax=Aphanomyces invadans TaxID=157072 RepID=A0A418B8Z7_9STRA|nr:hypothetical protein DYB32_000757 [Aphanomyces invadans]